MVILQHKDYGLLTTTFTICQNWLVRVSPVSRKVACSRLQDGRENGSRKMCKKPPLDWGERVRSFSPLAGFFLSFTLIESPEPASRKENSSIDED